MKAETPRAAASTRDACTEEARMNHPVTLKAALEKAALQVIEKRKEQRLIRKAAKAAKAKS
jgi:hypothetical protein